MLLQLRQAHLHESIASILCHILGHGIQISKQLDDLFLRVTSSAHESSWRRNARVDLTSAQKLFLANDAEARTIARDTRQPVGHESRKILSELKEIACAPIGTSGC